MSKIKNLVKNRHNIKDFFSVVKNFKRKNYNEVMEIMSKNEIVRNFIIKRQDIIFFFLRKYKDEIILIKEFYFLNKELRNIYPD